MIHTMRFSVLVDPSEPKLIDLVDDGDRSALTEWRNFRSVVGRSFMFRDQAQQVASVMTVAAIHEMTRALIAVNRVVESFDFLDAGSTTTRHERYVFDFGLSPRLLVSGTGLVPTKAADTTELPILGNRRMFLRKTED